MPARTRPTPDIESFKTSVPKIFDQVQSTTANHQKNFIALYKLHTDAAKQTESVQNGKSVKLVGERAFEEICLAMLSRALPLKKGVAVADRTVKFLANYTRFVNEKAAEDTAMQNLDEDDDTTASRFAARILQFLLAGCSAKDKSVRFRVVQCISEMITQLGEIDEDLYTSLRSALMERVRDKESTIRTQAIFALSKLAGSEDVSELEEGESSIMEVLLDSLAFDTSSDARRAALINLPLTPRTLPLLLARTRDTDPAIRKTVYSVILEPHCLSDSGIGFTHPRALSIAQRELIVRNGLGDREEGVKAAAAKLMATWVDAVRADGVKTEEDEEEGVRGDLIAFLKLFDLVEGKVAEDALLSVFRTRVDIFDNLGFDDDFWAALTPEKAFLARVFSDNCITTKDNVRLESSLPVVTALAFRIQSTYNNLLQQIQEEEEDRLLRGGMENDEEEEEERAKKEECRMDTEFIVGEIMKLAVNLDYADEIGRRKMFQLVRDMISHDVLPESLVARCLDILRILSPNERDLIRVVVEVIHELRDPSEPEEESRDVNDGESDFGRTPATVRTVRALPKPGLEMTPEERARADNTDLRCLSLCIGMLERVNGTFEENSTLEGILGELIIPAVKRKELLLRQKGLTSLGLCCLIARRMALNSFQLFLSQVQSAPEVLKISVLHIVFDILMVHEGDFLGPGSINGDRIIDFLLHLLENEESDKVQALLCIGISKLMLSGMIADDRVLKSLVLVYISPETSNNQELRQCLSYFFPVYCYSSAIYQQRMQKIFISLYEHLISTDQEWDDDQEPITPTQVALMFVDWTDPQKAVAAANVARDNASANTVHIDLASDIVKALFSKDIGKEEKKTLCQLLGKLYIPEEVDDDKLRTLKLLMHNLRSRRPLRDTVAQNAFLKFEESISKKFANQLEGFSEEEYRQLEYMKDLFEFLDNVSPDSDEEDVKPVKKGTRKRRSPSVATASATSSAVSDHGSRSASPPARNRGKGKAKRRRLSESDEESDRTETGATPPTSVAPTRVLPRRSAAERTKRAVSAAVTPIEDSDEEEMAPYSRRSSKRTTHPVIHVIDDTSSEASESISQLEVPEDSEEEEVEEVDDIL